MTPNLWREALPTPRQRGHAVRLRTRAALGVLCCAAPFVFAGCASLKAVDTTAAIEALTAGESRVTYTVVPGEIAGMSDKTLAIPTVPGKNVKFRSYYPDGKPQWELDTSRDAIVSALLSGAAGIDAAKFAHDQWVMEQMLTRIDALTARFLPLLESRLAPSATAPAGPGLKETLMGLLTDPEYVAKMKAALK